MGAFFVGWLLLIVVITFQKINQMDIMGFKCEKKVKSIVLPNNNSKRNTSAHLVIILFCSCMVSLSSVYRLICEQHWTIGYIIWLTNYLLCDWYNKIIFAVFSINSMINLGEYCTSREKNYYSSPFFDSCINFESCPSFDNNIWPKQDCCWKLIGQNKVLTRWNWLFLMKMLEQKMFFFSI